MSNKPVYTLIDPFFVGKAVYGSKVQDGVMKMVKLSRLVDVDLEDRIIETKNSIYEYDFTKSNYSVAFNGIVSNEVKDV